jgi:hypothetical protein
MGHNFGQPARCDSADIGSDASRPQPISRRVCVCVWVCVCVCVCVLVFVCVHYVHM